ncbi:DUF2190 family protein [Sphingomonadaceae bacterium G21617-S1]|nr:DUF2190 family protein [Sphingomonadaceae bacterium G21617-S1]
MNNFVQEGEVVTAAAPYDVASGAGLKVGSLIGIAAFGALSGADVNVKRRGVFTVAKAASQAWTQWTTKVYWDDTAKNFTSTSASNTLVGIAAETLGAGAGITSGKVLLTGQIV